MNCRCPHCEQLYEVSAEAANLESVFQCTRCSSVFSVDFSLESPLERTVETAHLFSTDQTSAQLEGTKAVTELSSQKCCPKCSQSIKLSEDHCIKCQVIFEKMDLMKPERRVHPVLLKAWKSLVADYQNKEKHSQVHLLAIKHNELNWVVEKYQELKATFGGDDRLGDEMLSKLFAQAQRQTALTETQGSAPLLWMPSWARSVVLQVQSGLARFGVFILGALAISLIVFGLTNNGHRNLIGLGVSLLSLIFGFQTMIRPKKYN